MVFVEDLDDLLSQMEDIKFKTLPVPPPKPPSSSSSGKSKSNGHHHHHGHKEDCPHVKEYPIQSRDETHPPHIPAPWGHHLEDHTTSNTLFPTPAPPMGPPQPMSPIANKREVIKSPFDSETKSDQLRKFGINDPNEEMKFNSYHLDYKYTPPPIKGPCAACGEGIIGPRSVFVLSPVSPDSAIASDDSLSYDDIPGTSGRRSIDATPPKVMRLDTPSLPSNDDFSEDESDIVHDAQKEEDEEECLDDEEIKTIVRNHNIRIGNNDFTCPVQRCSYVLKSPRGQPRNRRQQVRRHLENHKEEKPWVCQELGCDAKFTSEWRLQLHQNACHTKQFFCPIPNCDKFWTFYRHMTSHLFFKCIQPDFLFCSVCKYRIGTNQTWSTHWESEVHKKNCDILEKRGIVIPAKPTQNIEDEMKKAVADPDGYKDTHCTGEMLGIISPLEIELPPGVNIEKITPFPGYIPTPEKSSNGTMWCTENGVPLNNHCQKSILHNLILGQVDTVVIPVLKVKTPIIYELPIVSSSNCLDYNFNYILTCRKHTQSDGIRSVGMSTDQEFRKRFHYYTWTSNKLTELREKWESTHERDMTEAEFAELRLEDLKEEDEKTQEMFKNNPKEWCNCRKYRHFATKGCSVNNMVFTIVAKYPFGNEGRNDCRLAEAYYQFAIDSCGEKSGGLDEKKEYENAEKYSEQLSRLKLARGKGGRTEQEILKRVKTP